MRTPKRFVPPLLFTLVICVTVRAEFRTLGDETNLIGSATSLYREQRPWTVMMGYRFGGKFKPLEMAYDKRPLAFSYLTSVLHRVAGFNPANAFVLNLMISFALLYLLFLAAYRSFGPKAAFTTGLFF